jgi:hypothetical protein
LTVVAETPAPDQGETAERPRPAPKARRISESAAAVTAPAAMAGHDTPVVCRSTTVVGPLGVELSMILVPVN